MLCKSYRWLVGSIVLLYLTSCSTTKQLTASPEISTQKDNLEQLAALMPGVFINNKQYEADQKNFYHIQIQLFRIWDDRDDGKWFYIEQAQVGVADSPYRQRVYQLTRGERDTLISKVYTLPDPNAAIGMENNPAFWRSIKPEQLKERIGCSVYLVKKSNAHYVGGTKPNSCSSRLAGAQYATSEVSIQWHAFMSLDRGYDENDEQVWGSEKGAYIFERIVNKKTSER